MPTYQVGKYYETEHSCILFSSLWFKSCHQCSTAESFLLAFLLSFLWKRLVRSILRHNPVVIFSFSTIFIASLLLLPQMSLTAA